MRVCACVGTYVRVCMKLRRKHLVKEFSNSLIIHTLYTRIFIFILAMWDFVSCFKCASEVVARGASDARVEDELSIFTYGNGYAAQSYSLVNCC